MEEDCNSGGVRGVKLVHKIEEKCRRIHSDCRAQMISCTNLTLNVVLQIDDRRRRLQTSLQKKAANVARIMTEDDGRMTNEFDNQKPLT